MKINWELYGAAIIALVDTTKVIIGQRENDFIVRIYDMSSHSGGPTNEKSCNNLIEALHWAEDELKFHSGARMSNA